MNSMPTIGSDFNQEDPALEGFERSIKTRLDDQIPTSDGHPLSACLMTLDEIGYGDCLKLMMPFLSKLRSNKLLVSDFVDLVRQCLGLEIMERHLYPGPTVKIEISQSEREYLTDLAVIGIESRIVKPGHRLYELLLRVLSKSPVSVIATKEGDIDIKERVLSEDLAFDLRHLLRWRALKQIEDDALQSKKSRMDPVTRGDLTSVIDLITRNPQKTWALGAMERYGFRPAPVHFDSETRSGLIGSTARTLPACATEIDPHFSIEAGVLNRTSGLEWVTAHGLSLGTMRDFRALNSPFAISNPSEATILDMDGFGGVNALTSGYVAVVKPRRVGPDEMEVIEVPASQGRLSSHPQKHIRPMLKA